MPQDKQGQKQQRQQDGYPGRQDDDNLEGQGKQTGQQSRKPAQQQQGNQQQWQKGKEPGKPQELPREQRQDATDEGQEQQSDDE